MGDWSAWIDREDVRRDVVTAAPLRALAATLDVGTPDDALPPLWHWLFCLETAPASRIGPDGHPVRGDFLPPVPQPRRMWAGGRLTFHDALRVGDTIVRTSRIASIAEKAGATGPMTFVTVSHAIETERGPAIDEVQDIVFLDIPSSSAPRAPAPLPAGLAFDRAQTVDPVLLFRFSALTFNAHRIHYDRAYARDVEKYPGLVVHGPLQAMLLAGAVRDRTLASFEFRAMAPLFDSDAVRVCGRPNGEGMALYTANGDGHVAMKARAVFRG